MTAQEFAALLGLFIPLITAGLVKASWSGNVKSTVALVLALGVGGGTAYFAGMFDATHVLAFVLATFGAAQAFYLVVLRPLGITCWIMDNLGPTDRPTGGGA